MRAFLRHPLVVRLLSGLVTLAGVAVLVFVMLRAIPGDQITASLGTEAAALSPEQLADLKAYYGLDQPLVGQFFAWLGAVLTGNLGFSTRAQTSVGELILATAPTTLELAILAIIIAVVIGVTLGMLAAVRKNSARDLFGQGFALVGLSVPAFLLATVLLVWASRAWGFNPNGLPFAPLWVDPWLNLQQMAMPALTLGIGVSAPIIRTTRTAVLEIRSLDFIRTTRAKGVPESRVRRAHILRNALVPIVTMTGLQFGYLLGGAVVVEQVFSLPGIGRLVLLGIQQKEYSVVQSTVLMIALAFVLVNVLTDLLYRVIDPRVRAT